MGTSVLPETVSLDRHLLARLGLVVGGEDDGEGFLHLDLAGESSWLRTALVDMIAVDAGYASVGFCELLWVLMQVSE